MSPEKSGLRGFALLASELVLFAFLCGHGNAVVLVPDGIARHLGGAIHKACSEKDVGVVEHAFLQRDDDKLGMRKVCAYHVADVLCVAEIESRVNLIQDVHRARLEEQEGKDQR